MGRLAVVCVLATLVGVAEARPASSGWFAEGGLGAVSFLPPRASKSAALGPSIGVRVGYDVFSWLSLNIHLAGSSHEAIVPPPPDGEWFQLYRGAADLRLTGRIDRLALYLEGGVGAVYISSNVLGKKMITDPGEELGLMFGGGTGFEYQLENRHYSVGISVDGFFIPQFAKMSGIDSRAFLRYTY